MVFSAAVSGITLNWFNKKVQMFEGDACLDWKMLFLITIAVFVLFNIIIYIVFSFSQNVLPVQVFEDASSVLKKDRKAYRFLMLRRLLGKEMYLGMKFMSSKYRQNFMMILIIALITALAYTGKASLKLLKANDDAYNYNLVQGKTAKAELYNDKPISVSYAKKVYRRFKPVSGKGYMIYGSFEMKSDDTYDIDLNNFKISDLEKPIQHLNVMVWKKYNTVPKEKRVVMNEKAAEKYVGRLGGKIKLSSDLFGGKRDFVLVEIIKGKTSLNDEYNIIVDWDNLSNEKALEKNPDSNYIGLWLDGDKELIREKIQKMQTEISDEADFDWCIYDDMMEKSARMVAQWNTSLHVVLIMLLAVAGIGLINSANGMIMTRKKDYQILKMLGMSQKSIHKLCRFQVFSYMLSGVILGAIMGIIAVLAIWKNNVITGTPIGIEWQYLAGIAVYLSVLSLMLYPSIRKV